MNDDVVALYCSARLAAKDIGTSVNDVSAVLRRKRQVTRSGRLCRLRYFRQPSVSIAGAKRPRPAMESVINIGSSAEVEGSAGSDSRRKIPVRNCRREGTIISSSSSSLSMVPATSRKYPTELSVEATDEKLPLGELDTDLMDIIERLRRKHRHDLSLKERSWQADRLAWQTEALELKRKYQAAEAAHGENMAKVADRIAHLEVENKRLRMKLAGESVETVTEGQQSSPDAPSSPPTSSTGSPALSASMTNGSDGSHTSDPASALVVADERMPLLDRVDSMDNDMLRAQLKMTCMKLDAAENNVERLEMMVMPLEEIRREQKVLLLDAKRALLDAKDVGLRQRKMSDSEVPQYYASNSWSNHESMPWDEAKESVLTPGAGIDQLALRLSVECVKVKQLLEKQLELDAKQQEREAFVGSFSIVPSSSWSDVEPAGKAP